MTDHIKNKLKVLPTGPGVYQYYDDKKNVIYVGKAKNLKKRVSSYFTKNHDTAKLRILVKKIADIKTIVVKTEVDALLLENNLIKTYQPRYNVNLKDDKTYPWIVVKKENFPRVFTTRNKFKDGSLYFGPFASAKAASTMVDLTREMFKPRTCNLKLTPENIEKGKFKVCLEYHLGNCKGPCEGYQSEDDYNQKMDDLRSIIRGEATRVTTHLKKKMQDFSEELNFEEAAACKEQLEALEKYQAKSAVVSPTVGKVDVISILSDQDVAYVNYMRVSDGWVFLSQTLELKKKLDESDQELLVMALIEMRNRYQSETKEVLVPFELDVEMAEVQFHIPQRGDKRQLLELSQHNAKHYRLEKLKHEKIVDPERHSKRILERLKLDLRLSELPTHIECFDNSNIQGTNPVSACVVFKNAKPSKKDYRHFNIKTVEGPNDFASMQEAIERRYSRLLREDQPLPQLVVVDGGKGQLSSAVESFEKLGIRGKVALIGIAKRLEEIYYPGDSLPLYLDKKSESLKVIQHMRDEAHRFGITHHRKRRSKAAITSELDEIKGIGDATKQTLLKHFKSIKRIKEATLKELQEVVKTQKGELVYSYFKEKADKA